MNTNRIQSNQVQIPSLTLADADTSSNAAGMYEVMTAMMDNINAIQDYDSNGLMPLAESFLQQSQKWSNYWIGVMSGPGGDMAKIQADMGISDPGQRATAINADVAEYNSHNTLYNSASTYFTGITNPLNQSSSDTSQVIQIDLQMYSQGPQSQLTTITQAL